ncbi:hypothetical protein VNI00_004568 [Paramarasmius palmivorus]|uniref:Cytochrome P450 n=1 Tax=Paramarasmius palmivorus TaxID=297713 RepID=A0AAW0DI64_9AGAR
MESTSYLALTAILLYSVWKLFKIAAREPFLPPGPPGVPILGNILEFPKHSAYSNDPVKVYLVYGFGEWAKQYGGIYSLKLGYKTAIVLNDINAVRELLDKRSGTTIDRPLSLAAELVMDGVHMAFGRYDMPWRGQRKIAGIILSPNSVQQNHPIQRAEAIQVLHDFLETPADFFEHIFRYSNSVIMSVLWGKRYPRHNTKEALEIHEAGHIWSQIAAPGAIPPLDILPFLNYIPERWAKWKRLVKDLREKQRKTHLALFDECERRMKSGEGNGSYMEEVLRRQEEFGLSREVLGYMGTVLIEGGSDTTAAVLQSLLLFLTAHPEVQRKAQAELDRVVGNQRLPVLEDFDNLPYLQAIIKETHRIRPIAPIAIPHATTQPEQYGGYTIPQGAAIFSNTYGILHDPDPETFNPERFLLTEHGTKPGVDDSGFRANLVFGFGRRICPGIHLARNSLALNTMNLLWAFKYELAKDPVTGKEMPVDLWGYKQGHTLIPKPFKCHIVPRGEYVKEIVEREFRGATDLFVKYERDLAPEDKEWVERVRERW